jgi:hypothetical protein
MKDKLHIGRSAAAAILALCPAVAGCGGRGPAAESELRRLEPADRASRRRTPLGRAAGVAGEVKVITDGITGAGRASNVRMFDR